MILLSATEMLEDAGYAVVAVRESAAALRHLDGEPFSALITDIRLPGMMNGIALALSARERWPAIPVLYITGELRAEEIGSTVPGSAVLHKPFTPAMLRHAVHGIIGSDERVRANASG